MSLSHPARAALSIVFSTRRIDPAFIHHLEATVGVGGIEILPYHNPGTHSLAAVYNRALQEATADHIVFIHDDIRFEGAGWGAALQRELHRTGFGILGLAGTTDLILRPDAVVRSWWRWRQRAVGRITHQREGAHHPTNYSNYFPEPVPVVCVDGVLIAVDRRRIKAAFDERFTGFDFYDISFSFANHLAGVHVGVTFGIALTHFSSGTIDAAYENARQQFSLLYGEHLPYGIAPKRVAFDAEPIARFDPGPGIVSIIIPTKGRTELLLDCVRSLLAHTHSARYEILIADTGSSHAEKQSVRAALASITPRPNLHRIRFIEYHTYNFARINNLVVRDHLSSSSRYVLFCNNDIKLLNDAVDRCLHVHRSQTDIGNVGIRLHYANNAVQHNGIHAVFGRRRIVEFTHRNLNSYYHYDDGPVEVLGNSAAFMLVERTLFELLWFNEDYRECFEDVEFNLQLRLRGRRNIQLGNAVAYHYESQTRNRNREKRARMIADYNERLLPFFQSHCLRFFAESLRAGAKSAFVGGRYAIAESICRLLLGITPHDSAVRKLLQQAQMQRSATANRRPEPSAPAPRR